MIIAAYLRFVRMQHLRWVLGVPWVYTSALPRMIDYTSTAARTSNLVAYTKDEFDAGLAARAAWLRRYDQFFRGML